MALDITAVLQHSGTCVSRLLHLSLPVPYAYYCSKCCEHAKEQEWHYREGQVEGQTYCFSYRESTSSPPGLPASPDTER